MRGAGALHLHGGLWVFPNRPEQERLARAVLAQVRAAGGEVVLFVADVLEGLAPDAIRDRLGAERDQEYAEFGEGCQEFLAEIDKETARQKFTYPELEEIEDELTKLQTWLRKIRERDFFGSAGSADGAHLLATCAEAFDGYAHRVYAALGVETGDRGGEPGGG